MTSLLTPVFLHCRGCRLPSTPSGRRLLPIPWLRWPGAHTAEGVRDACVAMQDALRQRTSGRGGVT